MKKQANGDVRKFRGYAPVRAAKGFGPRHAENALEGMKVDLTSMPTDTVKAMLTPREAVLNRNAAEMAGRGNIEALNEKGNLLAEKGVDLAGGKNMKTKAKKYQGGGEVVDPLKAKTPLYNSIGGAVPKPGVQVEPGAMPGAPGPGPLDWQHRRDMAANRPDIDWMRAHPDYQGQWSAPNPFGQPGSGTVPPVHGVNPAFPGRGPGGVYPAGSRQNPIPLQGGATEVPGPIGSPNPQEAYGPPIQLSAPQLQMAAQKAGLSSQQIQGLMSAVQGFGSAYSSIGGGLGGGGTGGMDAAGAFQGGISDIGYPPFVAPNADYHADKGGWLGPYDPQYTFNSYARGIASVPFR